MHHGSLHERRWVGAGEAAGVQVPTREDSGHTAHIGLRVGFSGNTAIELWGAIVVQLDQANGEQLHELTGIVFIGLTAGDHIALDVTLVGQVIPHGGTQGDLFQQGAVITKSVLLQNIQVIGHTKLSPLAWHT